MAARSKAELERNLNWRINRLTKNRLPAGTIVKIPTPEEDAKIPAPAWYRHDVATIYLSPEAFDLEALTSAATNEWNIIAGAMLHEAGHAYVSRDFQRYTPTMRSLEELRVEDHVYKAHDNENTLVYLRAMFAWLLGQLLEGVDLKAMHPAEVANLWALTVGRTMTGIIDTDEVASIDLAVRTALGDDIVEIMEDLVSEVLSIDGHGGSVIDKMASIAKEWDSLFPSLPSEGGFESFSCGCGDDADNEETETETEPTPDGLAPESGVDPSEGDAPSEGESDEEIETGSEPLDLGDQLADAMRETVEEFDSTTVRRMDPEQAIRRMNQSREKRTLTAPTTKILVATKALAQDLESLSLPTVSKVSVNALTPPGRCNSREMVRMAADRHAKRMTTARPWRMTKRKKAHAKPLTVGIMTDTSGSMRWAEGIVAELAYTVAAAGHQIGARTAATTFGNKVSAVVKPGEIPSQIKTFPANGATEQFDWAAAAMDGMLHLRQRPNDLKVLIIVSDAELVRPGETERASQWVADWLAANTKVIWVGAAKHRKEHYPAGVTWVEKSDASAAGLSAAIKRLMVH